MNPLLQQIIIQSVYKHRGDKTKNKKQKYSDFVLAKAYRNYRISFIRQIKDIGLIIVGIFSAAFGFKSFLLTNNFIDGGATGVSLLISALTNTPLYILIFCVNIPFILLGVKVMGEAVCYKNNIGNTRTGFCFSNCIIP